MTGVITILSAGTGTGPFYIYSDVDGFTVPFLSNIAKVDLLAGYFTEDIPLGTTFIRVRSLNDVCNNYVDLPALFPCTPLIGTAITDGVITTTTTTTI